MVNIFCPNLLYPNILKIWKKSRKSRQENPDKFLSWELHFEPIRSIKNKQFIMKHTEDLKPQQYEDTYNYDDSPIIKDVRQSILRKFTYIGLGIFAMLMVMAGTLKIPTEEQLDFVIKADEKEQIYKFSDVVFVNAIYVKAGQKVHIDQSLATISSPQIVRLITEYNDAKRILQTYEDHDTHLYESSRKELSLKKEEHSVTITQLIDQKNRLERIREEEIERLKIHLQDAEYQLNINKKLYQTKAISEDDFRDSEKHFLDAKSRLKVEQELYDKQIAELTHRVEQLRVTKDRTHENYEQVALESKKKAVELRNKVRSAYEAIAFNFGNFAIIGQNLLLKSSVNGEISYVFGGDKEVPKESILLKILERTSGLYASASVPPQRVGYLQTAQNAVLKVTTFPHYRWGTLKGKIQNLSRTPDAKGDYPFEVQITDKGKIGKLLQIGMTGQLSIIVEKLTFYELLFGKFQDWKEARMD